MKSFTRNLALTCLVAITLLTAPPGTRASASGAPGGTPRAFSVFTSIHPTPLFYQAAGLAIGGRGNLFVADSGDHRILKVSRTHSVLNIWGTDVPGHLRLQAPNAIAVSPSGALYVADQGLLKLNSAGRLVRRWTHGPLARPTGVVVDSNSNVYVLSVHQSQDPGLLDSYTITRIPPSGRVRADWIFRYPDPLSDAATSVAIGAGQHGSILVSIKGQVHCHSCDGTYYKLLTLSPSGQVLSSWKVPAGGVSVTSDTSGAIYLAGSAQIVKLAPDGSVLATWGSPGCGPLAFGPQLRLAVSGEGLYVSDSQIAGIRADDRAPIALRDGVLHLLRSDGQPAGLFGACPASTATLFAQAQGIAGTGNGTIYVADPGLGNIVQIGPGGRVRRTIATGGHPEFVVAGRSGNLYFNSGQRDALQRVAPDGTGHTIARGPFTAATIGPRGSVYTLSAFGYLSVFGSGGKRLRGWQLNGYAPHSSGLDASGVATDRWGNVYIADTRNDRVQKYGPRGHLLTVWGQRGAGPGRFKRPSGIVIDPSGHVWVLDSGNNRVQEFTARGALVQVWGRQGQAPGQFNGPLGIGADGRGSIYVSDTANDRIQKLTLG
ncbi:MAG: NHL repeat-containing protein [Chloroflexota bacterium]